MRYFFRNFLARVQYERNSGLSHPVLAKNNAGKSFFNFLIFFFYFFWNFLSRIEYEQNSGLNFVFFSFSANLIPFWLKIMPERGFLIFFFYFFWNFLSRIEYEQNSGLNFFFLFLYQSHPVLAKNNAGKGFFNFLNFFCYFFRNFLAQVGYERNSGLKFFSSLSRPISSRFG